jgi:hypothetical protein
VPELVYTETLVTVTCWCGINCAIPRDLEAVARRKGQIVYCPLGHQWAYTDTTVKELERERQRREAAERQAQATRDLLHAEERAHAATRGHLTRQRRRARAGVCPCCNRTFQQLARHMASQHPGFEPEALPPARETGR